MRLRDLLKYDNICIQCHDNPDADALASGYGVYLYLKDQGKQVSLIYGGKNKICKSNLVLMIKELEIPVEYVSSLEPPQLLVTVDCQYGGGNVTRFEAQEVAVIDHHRISGTLPRLAEVKSNLGACSTLVWELLKKENVNPNADRKLATALYYGLYTDTSSFAEISHPLDKDLRDEAEFDSLLITQFRNSNLSIEELEVAGAALLRCDFIEEYRCAIVKAAPCDPNILGIISDLVLEVDAVDICLVFNVMPQGVKLSLRSCVKEVQANELAEEICKGLGSGGGHYVKAGGFLFMNRMIPEYEEYCKCRNLIPRMVPSEDGKSERPSDSAIKGVLESRLVDYFKQSQIIYAKDYLLDTTEMQRYRSRPVPMGYVRAAGLFPTGTAITVRTVEGDIDTNVEEDTVILIGVKGEVSLMKESNFLNCYRAYDVPYTLSRAEYRPTVKTEKGRVVSLMKHAATCIATGETTVWAKEVSHNRKLFTEWDETKYIKGHVGDYLVIREDNHKDISIMAPEIFCYRYERLEENGKNAVKSVIFDLDGTLLDTLEDLTDAVNYALGENGLPLRTIEEVRQFVGNGVENLMIRAIPDGKEHPQFAKAFEDFKEFYGQHCKDKTRAYEGIGILLEELKARGVGVAIVSNKLDSAVKKLSEEYFSGYVCSAIGEMESVEKKPAPDTVEKALEELGTDRMQTLYVGDSEVDIQTAQNAGITCVSVTWGFRDAEFLKGHGARRMIDDPLELLQMIG